MIIALDAEGGDYRSRELVKGAAEAADEYGVDIILIGKKTVLDMLVRRHAKKQNITIIEASQSIDCSEPPVQAVRSKPDSAIVIGTNLVKDGTASAFVSAGSTGAVLAAAFLFLGRIKGVQRPALCGIIQLNPENPVLLIDVGANVDCRPEYLVQFGQLGATFANKFLLIENPKVALLNNGAEEIKGNLIAKESYQHLKKANLNFIGNVEGQEILSKKADVIVTDGFTGNIVLKSLEGFGDAFLNVLGIGRSFKVDEQLQGSALVRYVELASMLKRMDYKEFGGSCLLGVNGTIIVAHGRSQARAIKNAIHVAQHAVETKVVEAIQNSSYLSNQ
jgi:glycerol-3-phosphate acyltransferase PlsX